MERSTLNFPSTILTYESIKSIIEILIIHLSSVNLATFPTLSLFLGEGIVDSIPENQKDRLHKKLIAIFTLFQIFAYQSAKNQIFKENFLIEIQKWIDFQIKEISTTSPLLKEFFALRVIPFVPTEWNEILFQFHSNITEIPPTIFSSILGPFFSEILPLITRKQLASYFTKPLAADLMISLLLSDGKENIFDPACGAGQLLHAVTRWKSNYRFSKKTNISFSGSIYGIELVPFAARLSCISLLPWVYTTNKNISTSLNIVAGDTFSTLPVVSWADQKFDVIVANPPFTKQQNIDPKFKQYLTKSEFYKNKLQNAHMKSDKVMGLHFYYLDLIQSLLPSGGRCGIIIPLNISYSHTGKENFFQFLQSIQINYLICSEKETAFSEGSNMAEIMIIGTKTIPTNQFPTPKNDYVQCITLSTTLSNNNQSQIINAIKDPNNPSPLFRRTFYTQQFIIEDLKTKGWHWLFSQVPNNNLLEKLRPSLIPLGQLIFKKHLKKERGINVPTDFFFLPNSNWKLIELTLDYVKFENLLPNAIQLKIPTPFLVPILRKPEYYKNMPFIKPTMLKDHFILSIPPKSNKELNIPESISIYLDWGIRQLKINQRSNTKSLNSNWFELGSKALKNKNRSSLLFSFKWDPRYRSFLMNYSPQPIIAGQAFWSFKSSNPTLEFGLATWLNSTLGMAFIGEQASYQRRVWRQLTGPSIDQIRVPSSEILIRIGSEFRAECISYLQSNQSEPLKNQLQESIDRLKNQDANIRIIIDRLLLQNIMDETNVSRLNDELFMFYTSFLNDLKNSLDFID